MFGDLAHFGDLLRRHARYSGQRIGIIYGDVRLTWQQLNARANRFASALQQRGVRKGDRVAVLSRNCHECVEILFGLAKIGVISVPVNYRLAEPEIEFICNDSGAVFLMAGPEYVSVADRIASRSKHVKEIIALGPASPNHCASYDSLIEAGHEAEPVPDWSIAPEDL